MICLEGIEEKKIGIIILFAKNIQRATYWVALKI